MLAADKLQLQSALKQQATALKEKEFNLHHSNFSKSILQIWWPMERFACWLCFTRGRASCLFQLKDSRLMLHILDSRCTVHIQSNTSNETTYDTEKWSPVSYIHLFYLLSLYPRYSDCGNPSCCLGRPRHNNVHRIQPSPQRRMGELYFALFRGIAVIFYTFLSDLFPTHILYVMHLLS